MPPTTRSMFGGQYPLPDPPNGPQPDEDSMDWLWFRPGPESSNTSVHSEFSAYCFKCDVYYRHPGTSTRRARCWCCGRFLKKPAMWNGPAWGGIGL